MKAQIKKIGLIVNPLAGIGGKVGLKGSDGIEIVEKAISMGAVRISSIKAKETIARLAKSADRFELATYPEEMGERIAKECGLNPLVLGRIDEGRTKAEDTIRAAKELRDWGATLIIFAGGDGTARDIANSIKETVPVLGIPTGVKIYSSVFATSPTHAADVVIEFLKKNTSLVEREVMDIDEAAFRQGTVKSRLYDYLLVPFVKEYVQSSKIASRYDPSTLRGVAFGAMNEIEKDKNVYFIFGPGSTVNAISKEMGIDSTLLGVDVYHDGQVIGKDVGEEFLMKIVREHHTKIIVTPIGGQGYIFGRGNQQISSNVITIVGRSNLIVVSTLEKLHSIGGPLRVDTGDPDCDKMLEGYIRVITGPNDFVMWKVVS